MAWPLSPGRDFLTDMVYFLDLLNPYPVYHLIMVYRTPVAPVFWGVLLTWGQPFYAEITMGMFYVATLLLVNYVAGFWGRRVALIADSLFLCSSSYAWLYHVAGSEALFAFLFMAWIALIVRTHYCGAPARWFALHGLLVFLLTMIRPVAQLYVPLFVIFPFLLRSLSLSEKMIRVAAFLIMIIPLLLSYSLYNYVRYDDFTVSRTSAFHIPFYRLFLARTIHPENGPASQQLISAVNEKLIVNEPYLSRHIDEQKFFYGRPNGRMLYDLVGLSDRVWGWDSDYGMLFRVSAETLTSRPFECARLFALGFVRMLHVKPEYPAPKRNNSGGPSQSEDPVNAYLDDKWIPRSYFQWTLSSPYIQSENPVEPAVDALHQRIAERLPQLPARNGSELLAGAFNFLTIALPGMGAWLFLGLLGFLTRPHHDRIFFLVLVVLTLVVPSVSYVGIDDIAEFRTIFDPVFIILGLAGILGGRQKEY
jgi:hypothetical protein